MGCNKCGEPTPNKRLCSTCLMFEREHDDTIGDGGEQVVEPTDADEQDEIEPYDGVDWSLECSKCARRIPGPNRSQYVDCPDCGDVAGPHKIRGVTGAYHNPGVLAPIFERDEIRFELVETDRRFKGVVSEVGAGGWDTPEDGAKVGVYVDDVDEADGVVVLEVEREHAGVDWGDVVAVDTGGDPGDRLELGTVSKVDVLERPDHPGDQGDEQADAEDEKTPQADDQAMSHADVDERDPDDDAPDPEVLSAIMDLADDLGVTFEQAEEVLEDVFGPDLETALPRADGGDGGPVDIESAVRDAIEQGDPDVVRDRVDERADELDALGLSPSEAEVVAWKEQGLTHDEIAEKIGKTKSTVDEYSRRARAKKLDARDEITRLEALVDELDETFPVDE